MSGHDSIATPAPVTRFPALAGLRLAEGDLALLACQGFVAEERRGDYVHHKLRFRRAGRQVVRYVGNAAAASAVNAELDQLRVRRRLRRRLCAVDRAGRRRLRDSKTNAAPLLTACGFKFHGRHPRKSRVPVAVVLLNPVSVKEFSMDSFHNPASREFEEELDAGLSEVDEPPSATDDAFFARLNEHRQNLFRGAGALAACIGTLSCDLMEFAFCSGKSIKSAIATADGDIYEIPEAAQVFHTHGNIGRQIDRYENLVARLEENERRTEKIAAQRRSGPGYDPLRGFKH
jgi:hypothetical protein